MMTRDLFSVAGLVNNSWRKWSCDCVDCFCCQM